MGINQPNSGFLSEKKTLKFLVTEMHETRPDAPYGLNVVVNSQTSISLTWKRPEGLVTSYIVQYGNAGSPVSEMRKIDIKAGMT